MFTGIIEAIGEVADIRMVDGDMRLTVRTGELDLSDVELGDSIATNGVCLTAVELPGNGFVADVSCETLAHSRFTALKVGERVNLEKAMMPTSRFGGHIVTGHVDGLGKVLDRQDDARSVRLWIQAPKSLLRYIAAKGSITVDGVSLTVNSLDGDRFGLNIVPHTAQETIIDTYRAGQEVHLEVDIIARYLERLMVPATEAGQGDAGSGLTLETLAAAGFMRR
ncbi:Riboflavin synthase eubacterial/eukaryotic [Marinobacterium lacunae]|uniref:Riboflavin synthase n=1 Tax=Marinobacterium lacunae TaxID=1232683 RepID=A0A081G2P0_9GAMM|nr:riboflavin synthase [Marinobacterium lacunae]KEA65045.1 Riboflavin synthase eubacterial/eukaryotic [Marinobacterium lacunae]